MFCGKCGVENADGAGFCSGCGAKLNDGQVTKTDAAAVGAGDKNRKVGAIAAAVLAVVVILIIVALFGGRSYKATANKFIKAQFSADAETILDLVPDKVVDCLLEEEGYDEDELDEFIEDGEDALQSQVELFEMFFGEEWKVTHKISDVENVTGDDLDDLKDDYRKDYDVKVSAAKIVEVELTIKYDKEKETDSMKLTLVKVGRSWYLDAESMGSFF